MRKALTAILALFLAFPAFSAAAPAPDTVLILLYLCGSDLETEGGSASADLRELMRAGVTAQSDVRVLVETGGALSWETEGVSDVVNQRHLIGDGELITVEPDLGKRNMGDAGTLSDFITYGFARYPAERTLLILWDHGGGPVGGVCFDEHFDDDGLTLQELGRALGEGVPKGEMLEMIALDACLMSSAEVGMTAAGSARYLLASQEIVTGSGFDYDKWVGALAKEPGMETGALCRLIVDTYIADNSRGRRPEPVTLAALDLSRMPTVAAALNDLGAALAKRMEAGQFNNISRARRGIRSFGEFVDSDASDLVDLLILAGALAPLVAREARALAVAARSAILYSACTESLAGDANGLSVFFPYATTDDARDYLRVYEGFGYMPAYARFVADATNALTGNDFTFNAYTPQNLFTQSGSATTGLFTGIWGTPEPDAETLPPYAGLWGAPEVAAATPPPYTGLWDAPEVAAATPSPYIGLWGDQEPLVGAPPPSYANIWAAAEDESGMSDPFAGLWDSVVETGTDYYSAGSMNQNIWSPEQGASEDIAETAEAYFSASHTPTQSIYSIQLTRDELDHLASADAVLMRSLRDGAFVELGMLGITRIDWNTGMVYSLFDGSWPMLSGQMVCMRQTESSGGAIRGVIPARIDGEDMYLLASFDDGAREGVILGATRGYDAQTGLPSRGYTPLQPGMVVTPLFTRVSADGARETFLGDPIEVGEDGLDVAYGQVDAGGYRFGFSLNDVYGGSHLTQTVSVRF